MRIVSRTPQALSCCTARLGSNLQFKQVHCSQTRVEGDVSQRANVGKKPKNVLNKDRGDSREGQLEVIGFDAADVVRSGRVQSLHQHLERVSELQERSKTAVISPM